MIVSRANEKMVKPGMKQIKFRASLFIFLNKHWTKIHRICKCQEY